MEQGGPGATEQDEQRAAEDWLPGFLADFGTMSEAERDAAIEALPADRREALLALADARAATADADLLQILDSGHGGLERLLEVSDPVDLLAVLNLAVREQPGLVVDALFAAVVVHRSWVEDGPDAIADLRERWIWHVNEEVSRTQTDVRRAAAR